MYLGARRIRSAGRTSGSIEITLPARLRILEGVECRVSVRDGANPEIVLQPDLSRAHAQFEALWQRLRLGLSEAGDIGDFSASDFALTLFTPCHWQGRPALVYADAMTAQCTDNRAGDAGSEAQARSVALLGTAAGIRLGLAGDFSLAFGDTVAYLITGKSPGLGADFERGMAHQAIWGDRRPGAGTGSPMDPDAWRQAQPDLKHVFDQLIHWQEDRAGYTAARENWYRALTVEMGLRIPRPEKSSTEELL